MTPTDRDPAPPVTIGPDHPLVIGRSGQGVSIAVIDSGVHPGHPHVGGVVEAFAIAGDGSVEADADAVDRLGHGTAVLAAIHEKAPDAGIHVLKVFDGTLSATIEALAAALDRCATDGIRLVNLSLGIVSAREIPRLEDAVLRCRERGTFVISALRDGDRRWRLGALTGVVGVDVAWDCPRDSIRISRVGDDEYHVAASGFARPIPGVPPERNLRGVSLAVANVTGVLALALEDRPWIGSDTALLGLMT